MVNGGCSHGSGSIDPIHAKSSEPVELPVQFLPWLPSSIIHACSLDHSAVVVVIFRLTHACWGWLGGGGTEGPSAEIVCARKIKSAITRGMEHAPVSVETPFAYFGEGYSYVANAPSLARPAHLVHHTTIIHS